LNLWFLYIAPAWRRRGADRLYDGAYMPGETALYLAKMP
jgi:hypothetical protein